MASGKDLARTQENLVAKDFGGSRQPLSGGIKTMPGDVITPDFLLECKTRGTETKGQKTFTIHKAWLTKIVEEAKRVNKTPALVFRFKYDKNQWFVINYDDILALVQERDTYRMQVEELLTWKSHSGTSPISPAPSN